MFVCVPVKLILVKFDHDKYPVLKLKPLVVVKDNVTLVGGFTKPIVTNNVELKLKFDNEKPETNWLLVFWLYDDAEGEFTDCENTNNGKKTNKNKNMFFIN